MAQKMWDKMTVEEKLNALHEDANRALDMAEKAERRLEAIEQFLKRIRPEAVN